MRTLAPFITTRSFASDIWREMDRLFENATPQRSLYEDRNFHPATEIAEDENQYFLSLDLPGLKKEDIQIEMHENNLVISGERKQETQSSGKTFHRIERSYGSFKRSFTLPNTVSTDKIEAHYENGVLKLSLPKTAVVQAKKIEIQ